MKSRITMTSIEHESERLPLFVPTDERERVSCRLCGKVVTVRGRRSHGEHHRKKLVRVNGRTEFRGETWRLVWRVSGSHTRPGVTYYLERSRTKVRGMHAEGDAGAIGAVVSAIAGLAGNMNAPQHGDDAG